MKQWKKVSLTPTEYSPYGIRVIQKNQFNVLETEEFKNGKF
jgi:16S rRNA (cytosine967-C5)-methyltransferase